MSCRTLKSERMISKINYCIKQKKSSLHDRFLDSFRKHMGRQTLKMLAKLFQVATSFHPGHRKQKTRIVAGRVTSNKTENYSGFFFF